ncbi:hypothetical protein CYMTET_3506 [Cymbomonas tetramitiformis]|uniref:Uncharacterized protein n=1 Tax=Cymbomonas tetramitiformis TaxID=36881 RepID=A0AAE0H343_9CHLO|nr:hypothetical protein CYMTET_3506 [Cymbomonas tetramitiformis]
MKLRSALPYQAIAVAVLCCATTKTCQAACDPSTVNLLDFTQWQEEEGFWWGEYTFLDGAGDPYTTGNATVCPDDAEYCDAQDKVDSGYPTWNFPYDHYWGFIRMKIVDNKLVQRNVFVYPPQDPSTCEQSKNATAGHPSNTRGSCGINGNEKVFKADQTASDCMGNLAGPYGSGMTISDTTTTLIGNHSILYAVKTPDYAAMGVPSYSAYSELYIQNQLTTLPGNGIRVRTAQGFAFGTQQPNSVSYYREYRVADEDAWLEKLQEVRSSANIHSEDMCAFDSDGAVADPNCYEHFQMGDGTLDGSVTCEDMNGGDASRCSSSSALSSPPPSSTNASPSSSAQPSASVTIEDCDPSTVNLLDFTQWQEEEGFWWGEYTFLDGAGDPYTTGNATVCPDDAEYCDAQDKVDSGYPTWNFPYDHYWGFIRMKIVDNKLVQRNVFVYPPQDPSTCEQSKNATAGHPSNTRGSCGINGNEKVFKADQTASDCMGNLAGPYGSGMTISDTTTTLIGNHSILYAVKTPDYAAMGVPSYSAYSELYIQNQLTTLPGNGIRVRTAQGFAFGTQQPNSVSYYREYRVADEDAWLEKLQEVRSSANIHSEDMCAFDSDGAVADPNCYEHFQMGDGTLDGSVTCEDMNGGDASRCSSSSPSLPPPLPRAPSFPHPPPSPSPLLPRPPPPSPSPSTTPFSPPLVQCGNKYGIACSDNGSWCSLRAAHILLVFASLVVSVAF